ncbi:hypothetical protein CRM22_008237 [Opisthorchis felineus]|uniref:phosphoglucomutase (alpha-D-glucose-1,6-bisphosphate-dependent) n=1 Tax=Opisthorchis felineus TaxID=147828 RepID=A0A4V3SDI8_OPIFE|nr:hypothetical protein CRM22_008237 [Opisthorchis felineus]
MSHTQQCEIISKHTTPFTDQKPGTSGLRKPTKTFQQRYYTENFIQATLNAALKNSILGTAPVRLVVGGDGRYFLRECLQLIILPMCAANGVSEVLVGQGGILSTPAASCIIRTYKLHGGILLTASHNPGGPEADFGIKYNCENGGPSPEKVTNAIYEESKSLNEFRTLAHPLNFDLDKIGTSEFMLSNKKSFRVNVISSVSDYASYISSLFDFGAIRGLLSGSSGHAPFKLKISGLSGVTGPYIKELLCKKLGMPEECALKAVPLEDFGGGHPDPNLTYAAELVQAVVDDPSVSLAAAFDGDGDRNMIIGRNGFFVSPCDSLAVIADNVDAIKYFRESGMSGCARSMPTSRALDRYDYENCESAQGDAIISKLKELLKQGVKDRVFNTSTGRQFTGDFIDDFSYVDPVDHSETKNQGIRIMFTDGTRFVYRLSGTGSSGATLRMYIDTFEPDPSKHAIPSQVYLKSHIELALQLCGVKEITGRAAPTVIT